MKTTATTITTTVITAKAATTRTKTAITMKTSTTTAITMITTVVMISKRTWLCSVHPDSHSDHQARCVLVEDDVRGRGPAQSGLGKSSLLQLRAIAFRRCLPVSGIGSVDGNVGASSVVSESETFRGLSAENRDVRCATSVDWHGSRRRRFCVVAAVASVVVVVAGRGLSAVRG